MATRAEVHNGPGARLDDRAAVDDMAESSDAGAPDEPEEYYPDERPGFRGMLRRLDHKYPALSRLAGGRLDMELPAIIVSVGVHLALLVGLGTVGYAVHHEIHKEIQSRVFDAPMSSELSTRVDFQDLNLDDKPLTDKPQAGSFSTNLAPMVTPPESASSAKNQPKMSRSQVAALQLASLDVNAATRAVVPSAKMLGQTVSIAGDGAEHAGDVEGAVDRVAEEIVRRLEKGRTLVIWAFDASGSLAVERERLSKHIETVYTHINELGKQDFGSEGSGLLTAVVAFGHDRKLMTPSPTADKAQIIEAINNVPLDTTGMESTFGTVAEIVRKWGRFKDSKGAVYHPIVIVVTDEVGDDESRLDEAIDVANRAKVPVYVLGSQALFGRVDGYMDYVDPKTKMVHHHLPVRQGPESIALEQIKLPFWYEGYQYDLLDSGFGPYALSRLAGATGGIYFITRMGTARMGLDPVRMREYKPDWVGREQYEAAVARSPLRQAVLLAAQLTQQRMGPQPELTFPPVESPEFKEAMAENQAKVAVTSMAVDEALVPIMAAAKYRDKEPSRRWQAHYDLIRGRLLAMKIRCYEYNWACALMKKDPLKFKDPKSNAWKLVPSNEIRFNQKAQQAAVQAKELLNRLAVEHPGTPWALLAEREAKDPFGFNWVETYSKAQDPKEVAAEKKRRKERQKSMPKPADAPKL